MIETHFLLLYGWGVKAPAGREGERGIK